MGIPNYPIHLDDPQLQGFYDGLAAGELRLTADPDTGEWVWYPPEVVRGSRTPDWSGVLSRPRGPPIRLRL